MYIRTTTRKYRGKTYTNYLLVESLHTSKGPRQKVICSLGDLKSRPKEWLKPAQKVEAKLAGQEPLFNEPQASACAVSNTPWRLQKPGHRAGDAQNTSGLHGGAARERRNRVAYTTGFDP